MAATKTKPASYTDAQLKKGRAARLDGKPWTKVAAAAGVKAESHFSRILRERFPELNAPVKSAKPAVAPAIKAETPAKRPSIKKAPAA